MHEIKGMYRNVHSLCIKIYFEVNRMEKHNNYEISIKAELEKLMQ